MPNVLNSTQHQDQRFPVTFATYCRIETQAGGVNASPSAFIRAAIGRLNRQAMAPAHRETRRAFYKNVLQMRNVAGLYEGKI